MELESFQHPEPSVREQFLRERHQVSLEAARLVDGKMAQALSDQHPKGLETMTTGRWVQIVSDAMDRQVIVAGSRSFHVNTHASFLNPSTQEGVTGSDLAIYLEVYTRPPLHGDRIVSKTLLVQAKVGTIKGISLRCANPDLRRQLDRISLIGEGDGFLLVYTETGAYCVQVEDALSGMTGNSLRTTNFQASSTLIEKMANCTAGNCAAISPSALAVPRSSDGRIKVDRANHLLAAYARQREGPDAFAPERAVSITMTAVGDSRRIPR